MRPQCTRVLAVCIGITAASLFAAKSGNPILPGYAADPHIAVFGQRYYIYVTGFGAWSSADLTNWKSEGTMLRLGTDVPWAQAAPWAPAIAARDGKYFFYFSADHYAGVATGPSPTGPFTHATKLVDWWDSIDPMCFLDDDGQAYLFFGYDKFSVAKIKPDMITLDGEIQYPAAPKGYLEGPFMIKRKGLYYIMYSNDDWATPRYNVQYATAKNPLGPYTWGGRILEADSTHVGPGHHSILQIPGRDEWYIVYHRYNTASTKTRSTCIERLWFNEDGSIKPVLMTDTGVDAVPLTDVGIVRPRAAVPTMAREERFWNAAGRRIRPR